MWCVGTMEASAPRHAGGTGACSLPVPASKGTDCPVWGRGDKSPPKGITRASPMERHGPQELLPSRRHRLLPACSRRKKLQDKTEVGETAEHNFNISR